jgi:hypothetical protein
MNFVPFSSAPILVARILPSSEGSISLTQEK